MNAAPQILGRRSLYILPTREGVYYGAILAVMLLAAVNYSNGLAYVLTFLLGAIGVVAILQTHRNIAGVRVDSSAAEPVFAGQPAVFHLVLGNEASMARYGIDVWADGREYRADIPAHDTTALALAVPTKRRGYVQAPRVKIRTRFPVGLWRAWTRPITLSARCLVYPAPAPDRALPESPDTDGDGERGRTVDGDEFSGLREYRAGDSMQRVAWKKVASGQGWHTKQFATGNGRTIWFDWDQLPIADREERLRLLCRWILDAERLGISYGLRLPTALFAPALGDAHRARCLEALALFPTT